MAAGDKTDFVIYDEQFQTGMIEVLQQTVNVFNGASNGTILLSTKHHKGDFVQAAVNTIQTRLSRRITTSTATITANPLTQDEHVKVKLNRKHFDEQTLDTWKKIAVDPMEMSFIVGQQVGMEILQDYLNTSVGAADNAFAQDLTVDVSTGTMTHDALVQGMALFGDKGQQVSAFVMHSKVYYDLAGQSIADKITNVADLVVHSGIPATLGRPVILSDIPALYVAGAPDKYHTLALMPNAISCEESETPTMISRTDTGRENLVMQMQGESAWTLGLKGYKWDIANGGENPIAAALNTNTNWDKIVADNKSIGGAQIITL